ncbi:Alpha/Beta hydrolase protein [Microdochium trichocladiopsis]|uniref:Alpha/Beta hydrolase protein n=1 Tax=Microdochium trichocladiopsis TaxID=1682393 RepID=A0A9P8YK72_9PEZI|nr:Alpha/Beta hydrolase protein [Microdochium trichocladiopsis]KAH7041467.1 Alpha/Beta hydrolase protein [Microdochium trichocladiopsis]
MPSLLPNRTLADLRDSFAHQNLERLSRFEPPSPPPTNAYDEIRGSFVLDKLKEWSAKNKPSIEAAMKAQVFGAKGSIQWTNAFLPFMESTAVYLRDWGFLLEAWREIRAYKNAKVDDLSRYQKIVELHNKAYEQIDELAHEWGMHYVHICDLVSEHPQGKPYWDGPFCGAFLPNDPATSSPFIGLAFKGTNPFQPEEVAVDCCYQLIEASKELGHQQVSVGVYTGLFGTFNVLKTSPFALICQQLRELTRFFKNQPTRPRIHVTGHSLGGSYSQLCYAGLLTAAPDEFPDKATMGDQYTYGAPRIGSQDWARYNTKLVSKADGQTWRIVHNDDLVPQIPPTSLQPKQLNFRHVDQGVKIFTGRVPQIIPSEIEEPDPKVYTINNWDDFVNTVLYGVEHREYSLLHSSDLHSWLCF